MRAHRRPLVTAVLAGGLLCGMWFVPSANATGDGAPARPATTSQARVQEQAQPQEQDAVRTQAGTGAPGAFGEGARLADTGSLDITPYFLGGLGFLGAGAALLAHARIRSGREGLTPAVR
ncbi:hypothetical protein ACFSJS_12865 [Streptomyces desertarenae]|uniref:LPXTG cell wall anchor domain-containing protein n=1 Tax=Streptomyces desertarenae TaxID=2666184 RepID=A0ABW4PKE0_9ACTN